MKRILASLGAAAVLAAGAVVLTPVSASAASGCWGDAGQKSFDGKTYTARYCHNYLGDVVGFYSTDDTGYLYAGDNWFVCQKQAGDNEPVGDALNNWWLYTQGDDVYSRDGWGWFPANKVSGGNNYEPIPGLAVC